MSDLKEELYEDLQQERFDRTAYLQNRRQDIREATGLVVPRRASEAENWYDNMKSVLSRKLNPANDSDEDEQDEEDSNETDTTEETEKDSE